MSNSNIVTILILGLVLFVFTRPDKLPDMNLRISHHGEASDFSRSVGGSCSGSRCLTVYLSPSCPTSPRLTSMLISLSAELKKDDIRTDIIIGHDPKAEVNHFANKYPFEVFIDPAGSFFRKAELEFTPTFIVTNDVGEIISKQSIGYASHIRMRRELGI